MLRTVCTHWIEYATDPSCVDPLGPSLYHLKDIQPPSVLGIACGEVDTYIYMRRQPSPDVLHQARCTHVQQVLSCRFGLRVAVYGCFPCVSSALKPVTRNERQRTSRSGPRQEVSCRRVYYERAQRSRTSRPPSAVLSTVRWTANDTVLPSRATALSGSQASSMRATNPK